MKRLIVAGVICLSVVGAAPAAVFAAAATPANPLAEQAAGASLKNPAIRKAVKEGRISKTPKAAVAWHQKENQRRLAQRRAAAKRLELTSGSRGDQSPRQAK